MDWLSMITPVVVGLGIYLFVLVCWVFYVAVMHLKDKRDELHFIARVNAYLVVAVGLVLDVVLNCIVATLLFLDLPRELLLTSRLKRYKRGVGWRARLATWICEHLLNQFDSKPSGHC